VAPVAAARRHGVRELTRDGLPNVQSASALVVDLESGKVLYERDADEQRPIASLSKMMGALVITAECQLDPDALHEMTPSDRDAARGGDKTKLTTGWSFSIRDLMHAALMRSDNRALPALGAACGMTPAQLAARMTARARALGLTKTFFLEPTGLSTQNVSTAREVMVILREALKVPAITAIMEKSKFEITAHKGDRTRRIKIHSTDRLLTKSVAEIIGAKTGYTDHARYCFAVGARTSSGRTFGMVFLGGEGHYTRFADFTRVVHWLARGEGTAQAVAPTVSASSASGTALSRIPTPLLTPTVLDASAAGKAAAMRTTIPRIVKTAAEKASPAP